MTQPAENLTPSPDNLPRNVKVLGATSLVNDIGSEMIYPLLPKFLIGTLGGTTFHLGIMEGIVESGSSLLKLWSGGWSDRAGGRKGFVVFGYALTAVCRPLVGLVVAPWQLFLCRAGDKVGKGVRTSPRDALIADSTEENMRGRAFGFHRALDHLGAAIGPLLAMAFLYFWPGHLRELFLLTLIPGVAVVAILLFGLREPGVASPPKEKLRLTLRPFDNRFRLFLVALLIFTLGNSSDLFLLNRAAELGVATLLLPLLWLIFHVIKSVGNLFVGRLADRSGNPRRLILLGWVVYAAIYLAFALITETWQVWVFFLAYALYYALTEPTEKKLVAGLVAPEHHGLAFGWFHFAIGVAALPANILFGLIYEELGALAAFGWGAVLALIAALLLLAVPVTTSPAPNNPGTPR